MSCSTNEAADKDAISVKQFSDSLKDLKNLRKQLYSAADYFESSYIRDNHKQFVVESSKDYAAKALVNTVDHLGSVADKLSKFLDQKANEYSATNTKVSCIQQRLCTIQGLVHSRGLQQNLFEARDTSNHKHTILTNKPINMQPFCFPAANKSNVLYGNCISALPADLQQINSFSKYARGKANPPLTRRKQASTEASVNPQSFSFTTKEAVVKRSVSPHRLAFNLISKRSVSPSPGPSPSSNKKGQQGASEPRRAVSVGRRREMRNREMEVESYTKRSKHFFKALLSLHHSSKDIQSKQIQE